MDESNAQLIEILERFDQSSEAFEYYDLSDALRSLENSLRTAGREIPLEMTAELIAFGLVADCPSDKNSWGTFHGPMMVLDGREYPGLGCITPAIVAHWLERARSCRHPLLRTRYGDLVWDLSKQVGAIPCPKDVPRISIDGAIEAVTRCVVPNDIDAINKLERALNIAIKLQDKSRIERVRDTILDLEDRVGADQFPGLWGFSFDLLLEGGKKVLLTESQACKIISDLEVRLGRLICEQDASRLDPHHVEEAALRLARHYRRKQSNTDVQRVLQIYAGAYVRKAEVATALVASAWLKKVHDTLLEFHLRDEAQAVLLKYSEVAKTSQNEMHSITASVSIEQSDIDAYLEEMTSGEWDEVFSRLVRQYLPRRGEQKQQLDKRMGGLLGLCGHTIVGHDGRALASVGSMAADPEGNLIRQVSETMQLTAWFIHAVVQRLVTQRYLAVEDITAFINQSPVMDVAKQPIIEAGLRAYLTGDWLVAIHLLIPQIESSVRELVELTGGQTVKKGRNDGLLLRNLDELLRDESVEEALGADSTYYLRVLLTDQRGWNVRNSVAHGITLLKDFNATMADRLFHAILLLGCVREKQPEESRPDASESDITNQ